MKKIITVIMALALLVTWPLNVLAETGDAANATEVSDGGTTPGQPPEGDFPGEPPEGMGNPPEDMPGQPPEGMGGPGEGGRAFPRARTTATGAALAW